MPPPPAGMAFTAAPSVRFFDGRGANRPWLCEIPEPVSRVAWQSPVWVHPDTARANGIEQADMVRVTTRAGQPRGAGLCHRGGAAGLALMGIGQGHTSYGRYAQPAGAKPRAEFSPTDSVDLPFLSYVPPESANPFAVLPAAVDPACGGPSFTAFDARIEKTGRSVKLAKTDGSRIQHGRTFILTTTLADLRKGPPPAKTGLTMGDFPLTLPLPEGYDPQAGFLPAPRPRPLPLGHGGGSRSLHRLRGLRGGLLCREQHRHRGREADHSRAGRWPGCASSATTTNAAWSG